MAVHLPNTGVTAIYFFLFCMCLMLKGTSNEYLSERERNIKIENKRKSCERIDA